MNHQKDGHFGGRGIGRAETIDRNFPVWRCIKLDFDPSVNVINGRSQVRCIKFLQLSVYFASIIFVRLFRIFQIRTIFLGYLCEGERNIFGGNVLPVRYNGEFSHDNALKVHPTIYRRG